MKPSYTFILLILLRRILSSLSNNENDSKKTLVVILGTYYSWVFCYDPLDTSNKNFKMMKTRSNQLSDPHKIWQNLIGPFPHSLKLNSGSQFKWNFLHIGASYMRLLKLKNGALFKKIEEDMQSELIKTKIKFNNIEPFHVLSRNVQAYAFYLAAVKNHQIRVETGLMQFNRDNMIIALPAKLKTKDNKDIFVQGSDYGQHKNVTSLIFDCMGAYHIGNVAKALAIKEGSSQSFPCYANGYIDLNIDFLNEPCFSYLENINFNNLKSITGSFNIQKCYHYIQKAIDTLDRIAPIDNEKRQMKSDLKRYISDNNKLTVMVDYTTCSELINFESYDSMSNQLATFCQEKVAISEQAQCLTCLITAVLLHNYLDISFKYLDIKMIHVPEIQNLVHTVSIANQQERQLKKQVEKESTGNQPFSSSSSDITTASAQESPEPHLIPEKRPSSASHPSIHVQNLLAIVIGSLIILVLLVIVVIYGVKLRVNRKKAIKDNVEEYE